MVADWTQMDSMNADGDNHADLFGGDLFSDELLDIYNASEGGADSTEHDGVVPLANGKHSLIIPFVGRRIYMHTLSFQLNGYI